MDSLVSTEWLESELGASDLRILDATLLLPGDPRDPRAEYQAGHIPGAIFLDLEDLSDTDSPIPHMLPGEVRLASRMQALGLSDGQRFVVYDNSPLHSAARAWWMLRLFGTRRVAILDGGMAKWRGEGRPLESEPPGVGARGHFSPRRDPRGVADKALVRRLIDAGSHEIVDARGVGRFTGVEAEPRPGMASGHIPGSKNLPQGQLFEADNRWKQGEALRAAFAAAGIDLSKPMVTTCGSGITAAVLLFGAHLLGKQDVLLYDGSWSEWGADPETPKEIGEAKAKVTG
jgi:thiosulfate/3-mercaptopyruvate sulfurtransferase